MRPSLKWLTAAVVVLSLMVYLLVVKSFDSIPHLAKQVWGGSIPVLLLALIIILLNFAECARVEYQLGRLGIKLPLKTLERRNRARSIFNSKYVELNAELEVEGRSQQMKDHIQRRIFELMMLEAHTLPDKNTTRSSR